VKLNVRLSQAKAKLAKEMSPDPANTHQGQQPDIRFCINRPDIRLQPFSPSQHS
jgi:hypothetical protein